MANKDIVLSNGTTNTLRQLNNEMELMKSQMRLVMTTVINEKGLEGSYQPSPDFTKLIPMELKDVKKD